MEQYERIFRNLFGESLPAQAVFLLALAVFVGVPHLVRTWRDLPSKKHQMELKRNELELLSAMIGLAEKLGTTEDVTAMQETATARLRAIHNTLLPATRPKDLPRGETETTIADRIRVTGWLAFGALLSLFLSVLLPGLSLLIMLIVAAINILTGRIRRGTLERRAFYTGLTYVPVALLVTFILKGVASP
jgi:VIT1/CCC1 family predicted Fe2+/Mn2+ transporter